MKMGPIVSPKSREYFDNTPKECSMHQVQDGISVYSLEIGKKNSSYYSKDKH